MILVDIGMTIVGIDFQQALVMGLILGILNVIPYVGPWRALRGYLAAAPEADYQAALQLVREQAWDQVTWLAAVAFGGERELVE